MSEPGELSTATADCHPRQNATGGAGAGAGAAQLCRSTPDTAVPYDPSFPVLDPSTSPRLRAVGGGEIDPDAVEVLAGLGPSWPLTAGQRRKLTPKVSAALAVGWSKPALSAHLAANPDGVKSPAAVLGARLDDLPPAEKDSRSAAQRLAWCGRCDEPTRQRENAEGHPYRCPDCHPLRVSRSPADQDPGRPKPPSTHRPGSPLPTNREEQHQCAPPRSTEVS